MKIILTHCVAFAIGFIAFPVIAILAIKWDPIEVTRIIDSTITGAVLRYHGPKLLNGTQNEEERFYALGDAANEAFSKKKFKDALKYANELSDLTPKYRENWNYGNAIHESNIILGRLALMDGEIEKAKKHLIEAGKSPGSPSLNSFGPNMSLASDLLEKDEKDVVIEYLHLCKSFWENSDGRLDDWVILVKAGRIPDFGANMIY